MGRLTDDLQISDDLGGVTAGFHTGFFEKGGKSSDAPHAPTRKQ